jgi:hypothetical protein
MRARSGCRNAGLTFEEQMKNMRHRRSIVANEYLESEACELMAAVSHAYVRGRFRTYSG